MRTPTEIAWAAGFFEGEGWMHRNKSGAKTLYPVLGVCQKTREPLEQFQKVMGLHGLFVPNGNGRTEGFIIQGHERVQAAVAMMWPWLTQRRKIKAAAILSAYVADWRGRRWYCKRGHRKRMAGHRRNAIGESGLPRFRCFVCERGYRRSTAVQGVGQGVHAMAGEGYRINIEGQSGDIEAVRAQFRGFLDWLNTQGSATGTVKSASELHGTTDIDSTQGGE